MNPHAVLRVWAGSGAGRKDENPPARLKEYGRNRGAAVGDFAAVRRAHTQEGSHWTTTASVDTAHGMGKRVGRRSAMAEKLVIELTREKETPGTIRFQEQDPDEDPKVGMLYVKKAASKRLGHPQRIPVPIQGIQ